MYMQVFQGFDQDIQSHLSGTAIATQRSALRQVADVEKPPFRWICSLMATFLNPDDRTREVEQEGGSGVLIGSRFVLTAAHNVYAEIKVRTSGRSLIQEAMRIVVTPGREGRRAPFGKATSIAVAYPDEWKKFMRPGVSGDPRFDFALIKLDTSIGTKEFGRQPLGWWGSEQHGAGTRIEAVSDDFLTRAKILNVGGYPEGKDQTQWLSWDSIRHVTPTLQGHAAPQMISYLADTAEGQSGGPVWVYYPSTGRRYLVAVHESACGPRWDGCIPRSGGSPSYKLGVRITSDVLDRLMKWMQTM